jgi:flagellar biosynthesis protein FlhF
VDTPGVSARDGRGLQELGGLLRSCRAKEVHLVLSATSKAADALAAVRPFAPLGTTHLLFSRLDETTSFGSLLGVSVESGLPLSYFGTGREVPNDIQPAAARELARRVLRGDQAR